MIKIIYTFIIMNFIAMILYLLLRTFSNSSINKTILIDIGDKYQLELHVSKINISIKDCPRNNTIVESFSVFDYF